MSAPNSSDRSAPVETQLEQSGNSARIALRGRLDATTLPFVWIRIIDPLRKSPTSQISVDASELTYCDGAGLGLLVELRRIARAASGTVKIEGLSPELSSLLDRATPAEVSTPPPGKAGAIEQIGRATAGVLSDLCTLIAFLGEITAAFAWAVRNPGRVRWRDAAVIAEKAGANAVPVV